MGNSVVTWSYHPDNWDQDRFLALGGFTVVFLNYNKKAFIERSVSSALNQDYPLLEMFFMDDASTDGSGDIMEELVKAYSGRHKVTVIRNTNNQNITGQWNTVSKLATGIWYGMFCADDIAHTDRVSIVAKEIANCETLRGMCTAVNSISVLNDAESSCQNKTERVYLTGLSDLRMVSLQEPPIIGASAWWHKSLFDKPLTKAPLDDILLRWVLQLKYHDSRDPIWLWDGVHKTIDYSVGCGVSSQGRLENVSQCTAAEIWVGRTIANKKFANIAVRTWQGVYEYFKENNATSAYCKLAKDMQVYYSIVKGNTFSRLLLLPKTLVNVGNFKTFMRFFLQEFFGMKVASWISVMIMHRR